MKSASFLFLILSFLMLSTGVIAQEPEPMLAPRMDFIYDKVYLFGGSNDAGKTNEIWSAYLDGEVMHWTQLAPQGTIPDPVTEHAAVVVDSDWYIIGGLTDSNESNPNADLDIYKFSVSTESWELINPTSTDNPKRMNSHSAQYLDGFIYVSYQNQMWRFELSSKTWQDLAECPYYNENYYNLQWHTTAIYQGKFYVLRGGMNMGSDIYEYDPAGNSWAKVATTVGGGTMKSGPEEVPDMWSANSWRDGNDVFFIGFRDGASGEIVGDAWVFNLANFEWVKKEVYDKRYHGAGTKVVEGDPGLGYVIGGEEEDGQDPKPGELVRFKRDGKATLTMAVAPSSSDGCTTLPATGKHDYPYVNGRPQDVTLTALPDVENGWNFTHWSGDKAGSETPTVITMDHDKLVTAHFIQPILTFSNPGPERKVLDPRAVVEVSATKIMVVRMAANEVDDWLVSRIKFKNKLMGRSITKVFIGTPDGTVSGEMDAEKKNFTFNFNPALIVPKSNFIEVTLYYDVELEILDQTCEMKDIREYQAEIISGADVICAPLVYANGKKVVPNLVSNETFIACIENTQKYGFVSVEEAVKSNTTREGDDVILFDGSFLGTADINKSIRIKSKHSKDKTTITETKDYRGFQITANNVVVQGLAFFQNEYGLSLFKVKDCRIEDCLFSKINNSINSSESDGTIIKNCQFINCGEMSELINIPTNLFFSDKNLVIENCLFQGNLYRDLFLERTTEITIRNNTFIGETDVHRFACISLTNGSGSKIHNNHFSNNIATGIMLDKNHKNEVFDNQFTGLASSDVLLVGIVIKASNSTTIRNNRFENLCFSIMGSSLTNGTVANNKVYNIYNDFNFSNLEDLVIFTGIEHILNWASGISLFDSRKVHVNNNRIIGLQKNSSTAGIVLEKSYDCFINDNLIKNIHVGYTTVAAGIALVSESHSNTLKGNYLMANCEGIFIWDCPNKNFIESNFIMNSFCRGTGISIHNSSPSIVGNYFKDNVGAAIGIHGNLVPQDISYNSFHDNDKALVNETTFPVTTGMNFWGQNTGPMDSDIEGQVVVNSWLDEGIGFRSSLPADTIYIPVGITDSIAVHVVNYLDLADSVSVKFEEEKSWFTGEGTHYVQMDTTGSMLYQLIETPGNIDDGPNRISIMTESLIHTNLVYTDTSMLVLYVPVLDEIICRPEYSVIKPNDTLSFTVSSHDQQGRQMDLDLEWDASGGSLSEFHDFSAQTEGEYIIQIGYSNSSIKAFANVYVTEEDEILSAITTPRDTIRLMAGEIAFVEAQGWNQFTYPMSFAPIWTATGGTIEAGVYQAGEIGGEFLITISDESQSITRQVMVIVQGASGVGPDLVDQVQVLIYPNPTSGSVRIEADFIIRQLEVINLQGQLVDRVFPESNQAFLELSTHSAGLYYVLVRGDQNQKVQQVIVR